MESIAVERCFLYPALLFACLLLDIAGIVCIVVALSYRTEKHPGIMSFSPRNWIPVWKMQSWYTPKGYWLNLIGISMVVLSATVYLIYHYI